MKYLLVLLCLMCACATDNGTFALRYIVETESAANITVIDNEQGHETVFDHRGGKWCFDLDFQPPMPYKLSIKTIDPQTVFVFVVVQIEYDETYILNMGTHVLLAHELFTYEGWTPTSATLSD